MDLRTVVYLLVGTLLLTIVFIEIYKRLKPKPLAIVISEIENREAHLSQAEKRQKKFNSFYMRAQRVNWQIPKTYQQTWATIGIIVGGIAAFIGNSILYLFVGLALGLFYPFLQLRKKEEAFQMELPLRAEQAINAIEQQMQGDIPIFHAIKAAVPYMQSPLKEEYKKAVDKVEKASVPLQKALEDIPVKLDLPQLEYFHMIVEIAEETEERAREIVRDCSDMLRRQQQYTNRYMRATGTSRKEMTMMTWLVISMVASFTFMLPDNFPSLGPIQKILDVIVVILSVWISWVYRKKLNPRNLFY